MLFTVFTPTYNRRHTLPRLFESLRRQSTKDFEWLVVDDGSTDGTAELLPELEHAADFPVRYLRQPNGHKKVAINRGVHAARGELFLIIDSDDELVPEALERLAFHWGNIPSEERKHFSAVTGLCRTANGEDVGSRFPRCAEGDWRDSDSLEMRVRYRVWGEKCGFHRTSVLRRFPFPEHIPGYVSEGLVWCAIAAAGWRTRYVNEHLRVYHRPTHGDNLTTNDMSPHVSGVSHYYKETAPLIFRYLKTHPGQVYRHYAAMVAWSVRSGDSLSELVLHRGPPEQVALTAVAVPAGLLHLAVGNVSRYARNSLRKHWPRRPSVSQAGDTDKAMR